MGRYWHVQRILSRFVPTNHIRYGVISQLRTRKGISVPRIKEPAGFDYGYDVNHSSRLVHRRDETRTREVHLGCHFKSASGDTQASYATAEVEMSIEIEGTEVSITADSAVCRYEK
ncbi:hypothetical protein EVAR_26510_1 [Eumeta japonica]|uniref:Uncharacterized protein n=1 Tax=Eumeta variegata TaxID=151549 RepID=A0A4C1V890_EUMVA|nr:hypothetical protein EVAR_26510_1 [Eumeta japonica]